MDAEVARIGARRRGDVTNSRLDLTRPQILAFRRRAGALDDRLPAGTHSLRRAAWAGLQDSMPRAALLSIHARVAGATPSAWEDPALVQLWGPRFSVFVVAELDRRSVTGHMAMASIPTTPRIMPTAIRGVGGIRSIPMATGSIRSGWDSGLAITAGSMAATDSMAMASMAVAKTYR